MVAKRGAPVPALRQFYCSDGGGIKLRNHENRGLAEKYLIGQGGHEEGGNPLIKQDETGYSSIIATQLADLDCAEPALVPAGRRQQFADFFMGGRGYESRQNKVLDTVRVYCNRAGELTLQVGYLVHQGVVLGVKELNLGLEHSQRIGFRAGLVRNEGL